jgi:hypothetical protein
MKLPRRGSGRCRAAARNSDLSVGELAHDIERQ